MTSPFRAVVPLALLLTALPAAAQPLPPGKRAVPSALAISPLRPTQAEAIAFVAQSEAELEKANLYANRVAWVQATFITDDTNAIADKANAEQTELAVRLAKEAARFDDVAVDPVARRKIDLIKRAVDVPAPSRPGAADELATLQSRLSTLYATGSLLYDGKTLTLEDIQELLRTSRDPAETRALWEGWRRVSPPMRVDYARIVSLANEGARELRYSDVGALWRTAYDMEPDAFAAETDRLWAQLRPLYGDLHCYVRSRLNARYGDPVQAKDGPIRADLLGTTHGHGWQNIFDIVAPTNGAGLGYDLTERLVAQNYDAVRMMKTGEAFYGSLGFDPLPPSFWQKSMLTRPRDREVDCHPSAWSLDNKDDVRIKMCTRVNSEDFYTVHHELGHNIYQRAYQNQPFLFIEGANDGFHEAIGDFAALSALTPTYLRQIGLIDAVPGPEGDIPYLLRQALDKVAFLPFAVLVDRWRWEVFAGRTPPERYNQRWQELVREYQGLAPPGDRPADAFDPGVVYHVAAQVSYTRYFLASVYQFQFYRSACRRAGWTGPLNRCSIYGNREVGRRFDAMLKLGRSRPWPEALAAFTGETRLDASAIVDYFAPLQAWLTKQNEGRACGL